MRRSLSTPLRLTLRALLIVALIAGASTPAFAATTAKGKPSGGGGGTHGGGHGGGGSGGGGGGSTAATGYDVSWPQCGSTLPTSTAFGIVGVNDGLANNTNPCLADELTWAANTSNGSAGTPEVQLYVNTADPGNMYNGTPIADWPTSGSAPGYGTCTTTTVKSRGSTYTVGQNSPACAWIYGYDRAGQDAAWLAKATTDLNSQAGTSLSTNPGDYPWWLDVETGNSWMSDLSMNIADLQGMIAGFEAAGVGTSPNVVGIYSTASQWSQITGLSSTSTSADAGNLYGVPVWIPGASNYSGAKANCSQTSFTGGTAVTLTQWTSTLDNDYVC